MLDIGGESTRPGRTAEVPLEEELRRTMPVVELLARELPARRCRSTRSRRAWRARRSRPGAAVVNDVSGLRLDADARRAWSRRAGAGLVLMHSRGTSLELAELCTRGVRRRPGGRPSSRNCARALDRAASAGIAPDAVAVDPGLGFGKTPAQSLALLDALEALPVPRASAVRWAVAQAFPRRRHRRCRWRRATPPPRPPVRWPGSAARASSGCTTSGARARRSPWPAPSIPD